MQYKTLIALDAIQIERSIQPEKRFENIVIRRNIKGTTTLGLNLHIQYTRRHRHTHTIYTEDANERNLSNDGYGVDLCAAVAACLLVSSNVCDLSSFSVSLLRSANARLALNHSGPSNIQQFFNIIIGDDSHSHLVLIMVAPNSHDPFNFFAFIEIISMQCALSIYLR